MKADVHITSISSLFNGKWEKVFSLSLPLFLAVGHFDLIFNLSMEVNVIINGHSYPHCLLVVLAFTLFQFSSFIITRPKAHTHTHTHMYLPIAHANQITFFIIFMYRWFHDFMFRRTETCFPHLFVYD